MPLPLANLRNRRSLVGVESLARLLALVAHHPAAAGEVFIAADQRPVSTTEIVKALAEGSGRRPALLPAPLPLLRLAGSLTGRRHTYNSLCESLVVDCTRARRLLDWLPAEDPVPGLRLAAMSTLPHEGRIAQ
jgi:nucleoside-diphosphate-sugar epimerase